MKVQEMLRRKQAGVITIAPDATVHDAMRLLVQHNIGSVVVVETGSIRGILTERDLLRAGASDPAEFTQQSVEAMMTTDVVTAEDSMELEEVMEIMTERRIRHLPIIGGGELRGMISIGDVVNALRRDIENENRQLHSYITGTPM